MNSLLTFTVTVQEMSLSTTFHLNVNKTITCAVLFTCLLVSAWSAAGSQHLCSQFLVLLKAFLTVLTQQWDYL